MQGILLVDKPIDWTSFDVVNYVRRIVATIEDRRPKQIKVGHTGTLDPFATGLLVLLIGKDYTKRTGELTKLEKSYEVTMKLGFRSTTGDPEGDISQVSDKVSTCDEVEAAINQFRGQIMQVPPAYSAIKINGQRAYKLARAGKEVVINPRQVNIKRLDIISYCYPNVKLVANVSSGTYVRSLVEDIGQFLGTNAYTTSLNRLSIGKFDIKKAVTVKQIDPQVLSEKLIT